MFLRKIKHANTANNEETSTPFVRFLNEFEAQKSLFSKEGIELESNKTQIMDSFLLFN